ncbi:DUF2971 domain-containing protein [Bacillus pseudomycoides]|uniref:DUF2971 domain-containing protein n=1 Tax=Bacillus pseudomycoides TaxID=64104 RepID=UPI0015CF7312|nr:DUF2971 domain-containing protein [Bacillus pseudomycoides]MED1620089.1 DUF2971 domain-containing protein [Bacillus pseudomycoides]
MWIDEYIKLMYPKNVEDVQIEEAMQLKHKNIPVALYKYRAVDMYSIKNFENDEAWFNTAAKFNDPYDCALTMGNIAADRITANIKKAIPSMISRFNLNVKEEEISRLENMGFIEASKFMLSFDKNLKEEAIEAYVKAVDMQIQEEGKKKLEKMNEGLQRGAKICCFSEINHSILMWSHYANNHTGFCIEYNFKKEGIDPVLTRQLQPVLYRDRLFNVGEYFPEDKRNSINPLIVKYNAIIKSTEWSYEREWRIVFLKQDEVGFSRKLFRPQAIYLGAKMCDEEKERMIEIAKQKQILVFQMKMKNSEFKLVPERIL